MVEKSTRNGALLAILICVLFGLDVLGMHTAFTSKRSGANDFLPRWRGAQLYFLEGVDPYSEEATLEIQRNIRGRLSRPDEDQLAFAYPFYVTFLLIPLLWLPYSWVEAIWLVVVQFSLVGALLLYLQTLRWRLSPVLFGLTAIWTVLFYHSARTILLGQFAGLVFFWTVAVIWCLERRRDVTAGFFLALTTIKPQMSVLLIPALLWWALSRRRWRFLVGAAVTMFLLLGVSFLLLPGWLVSFVKNVVRYPSYTDFGNPLWVVTQYYLPQLGTPTAVSDVLEMTLSLSLLLLVLWSWRRLPSLTVTDASFHYLVGLTLIITNLVVPRTATTNYAVLYLPLFFALRQLLEGRRYRKWWLALFYLASFVGLWLLFFQSVQGDYESPVMFLPLPFALIAVFLLARHRLQRPFASESRREALATNVTVSTEVENPA